MEPLLRIGSSENGQRLDAVLARTYPQYSRSFFQKFLRKGGVMLSGAPREPDYRVRTGETFTVAAFDVFDQDPPASARRGPRTDIEPDILFEDNALLVICKPAGLVVHPAPGHRVGTLIDWVRGHLGPKVAKVFTDPERLGLIHRLDKDTSGVLLIAKSVLAQTALSRQFHDRTVRKTYVAFVEGVPSSNEGVINAPVGRSRKDPTRMAISPLGRASETTFEVKESMKEVSLVTLHPKTGRTHQLRVHLSAIGHPIVGDRTYGAKSIWQQTYGIRRSLLHAEQLELAHPSTGKPATFKAPWPADFDKALSVFRQAFTLIFLAAAVGSMAHPSAAAEEGVAKKPAASTSSGSTAPAPRKPSGPSSSDFRKLKAEVAALQDDLAQVKTSLETVNAGDRLRDLERASLDLNAKAVNGATVTEETKTQMMDLTRKVKAQQDLIDQLRDQVDRLQQMTLKQQAVETSPPPPASSGSSSPSSSSSGSSGSAKPWGSRAP